MLRPRIIPCLLLKGRGLYKTSQFGKPVYVGDPINTVRIFNEKEVDELVILDINAAVEQRPPNFELIAEIASEAFMPIGYGGAVTQLEHAQKLISIGVEKVLVNSAFHTNPALVSAIADVAGSSIVVVSVDVRKKMFGGYEVMTSAGKYATGADPVSYARKAEAAGAGEILLTSIDREGTMKGYDLELIAAVAQAVSIPVVCNGGAGAVEDFRRSLAKGASAAAAGAMFVFQGKHRAVLISYPSPSEIDSL